MKLFLLMFFLGFILPSDLFAQEQQVIVPYTLADRDRAIRTEERINTLESEIKDMKKDMKEGMNGLNDRINRLDEKLNRLENKFDNYFMWKFGLVLVAIFGLVGFIIYDRRTILAPLESKPTGSSMC